MSNTSKLTWNSSILELSKTKKIPKNLQTLHDSGVHSIRDLIWIAPTQIQKRPELESFDQIQIDKLFYGRCRIINTKLTPVFGRKGKGKVQLFNIQAVAKDSLSDKYLTLRWFNAYPNIKRQLTDLDEFDFIVTISDFNGVFQGINPQINPKQSEEEVIINYPTVNTVSGRFIQEYIRRIPTELWQSDIAKEFNLFYRHQSLESINLAFRTLHGLRAYQENEYTKAKNRLIYHEFLESHLKVVTRKRKNKKLEATKITLEKEMLNKFTQRFPYELTEDQNKVNREVLENLNAGYPMMRIVQGDVGSGKTTISIIASYACLKAGHQVAVMCPTEALALQHAEEFSKYLAEEFNMAILIGSTKPKDKKEILNSLADNSIRLVIGTHSLFQESVAFFNLKLAVIDEQHKFGVEQRQRLVTKGEGVHSLIMSATPIPRTLQLAQYGDLDISTIRSMPSNRKGIKTRIIKDETFSKFLSFLKTRVSLKEQAYIVTPAIEESELDINYLEDIYQKYKSYYPELNISFIHGQVSSDEKVKVLQSFKEKSIDILISTSVIEVGIDNPNASIMAIYNPERFGLSSLHQLRGRVGRGDNPGFCFLISDSKTSSDALERLKVLEESHDGFHIAQADLKNRGEGDLFGKNQSGSKDTKKLASMTRDFDVFEKVIGDVQALIDQGSDIIDQMIDRTIREQSISSTI